MRPPECNPIEENTELQSANKTKPVECGKVEHNYKKKKKVPYPGLPILTHLDSQ